MRCTKCGNDVNGTPFCPHCGAKMEAKRYCSYCGKELKDAPFCPHCGQRVEEPGRQPRKSVQESALSKRKKRVALRVILLLAVVVGIVLVNRGNKVGTDEAIETVPHTESVTEVPDGEEPDEDIYAKAVSAYEQQAFEAAELLFEKIPSYADSGKYLRLIRIRKSGGNIGVGSRVYKSEYALSESQKQDIDEAAADFYFADTAQVLVCNSDVASYYLIGDWNGGDRCYIHFIANDYGCRYNIGSLLSTNYQDTFAIDDGIVYVDVVDTRAMTLKLTLLSPDTMEVYTYEKGGETYLLSRE